ncbi:MAG: membrane protein insertion efficiency factor YidD [Bacilli bacterium]
MKYFLIGFIKVYQLIPGFWHQSCRHYPTCSNYGITAIATYGSLKGSYLTIKRILKCNPWGSTGYDPVPERKEK